MRWLRKRRWYQKWTISFLFRCSFMRLYLLFCNVMHFQTFKNACKRISVLALILALLSFLPLSLSLPLSLYLSFFLSSLHVSEACWLTIFQSKPFITNSQTFILSFTTGSLDTEQEMFLRLSFKVIIDPFHPCPIATLTPLHTHTTICTLLFVERQPRVRG